MQIIISKTIYLQYIINKLLKIPTKKVVYVKFILHYTLKKF